MDQSFNDQELSDIMKEIEALEDDFEASSERSSGTVLQELAQLEEVKSSPISTGNIVAMESVKSDIPTPRITVNESKTLTTISSMTTSMNFKVQGNLTLDFKLEIGEKVVSLFVADSGLTIEMDGGMKFTIPISENAGHKKAG